MKLQNEEVMLRNFSSLDQWSEQTRACISEKLFREKIFVLWCTNIENVEILHVLHYKVALLMRKRSEWGTKNIHQIIFRKVWTMQKMLIKRWTFYVALMRWRLDFLFYRSFSKFWNTFGGLWSQVRSDSKSFDYVVKSSHTTAIQL